MKHLSLILSLTSLSISAAIGVGAYITYQKAQKILDNPEEFVGKVVEKQVTKAFEKLPIPGVPKFKGGIGELNTEKFKLPF
jgi:hypothetical protein